MIASSETYVEFTILDVDHHAVYTCTAYDEQGLEIGREAVTVIVNGELCH